MTATLIILVLTIVMFIWGKYPPDVVALLSLISLFLTGVLTQAEALSGFSNPTVIMIAALFIIGEGLATTGWTAQAGQFFIKMAGKNIKKMLVVLFLGSGVLSGFVSNTGTVATLLPVTVSTAWSIGSVPSKLLMPVAFGSNTGGLLTLTGTPPNIIVSNALVEQGFASFSFFEFALIGLPLLIIAVLYFRYIGYRLLPERRGGTRPMNIDTEVYKWIEDYKMEDSLFRLRIRSMSPMINTMIKDWQLEEKYQVSVVRLRRRHPSRRKKISPFVEFPQSDTVLRYHDIITVKGPPESINQMIFDLKLGLLPPLSAQLELKEGLINQEVGLAQMIVTPRSFFVGRSIPLGAYLDQLGIQLVAGSRNNRSIDGPMIKVKPGDAFLIRGTWEKIEELKELYENLVISGSPESMAKDVDELTPKSWIALGALILLIVLLVFHIVPGSVAALISAGIVLLTRCVPLTKAYRCISWVSVIMIAAMIPMGIALQKTGLAEMAAEGLVNYLGEMSPYMLLAGIFLLTTGFSQTINNSATAVLMAPIAILAATNLGVSPMPFMIVVAISASTAFLTPVGTTTNAMVMAAGRYQFMDYVKVGLPLLFLFCVTSLILVPIFWPF